MGDREYFGHLPMGDGRFPKNRPSPNGRWEICGKLPHLPMGDGRFGPHCPPPDYGTDLPPSLA